MASPAVDKFPIQVNYLSESLRWDNTLASLKMTEVSKSVNQNRVTKMVNIRKHTHPFTHPLTPHTPAHTPTHLSLIHI